MKELELSSIELEKCANEYFDKMIEKDPNFIDNCSDDWIFDEEEWFYDQFDAYIERKLTVDFLNMCKAIWIRHYDELHAYDDYSKIIISGDPFNKIIELQRDLLPAQKYLCNEPWASNLTEEQAKDRLSKFKSINNALVDILKTLGTLSDELRLENLDKKIKVYFNTVINTKNDCKFSKYTVNGDKILLEYIWYEPMCWDGYHKTAVITINDLLIY